jgi:hypothetical protein
MPAFAALNGHFEILQWAKSQGCLWNELGDVEEMQQKKDVNMNKFIKYDRNQRAF